MFTTIHKYHRVLHPLTVAALYLVLSNLHCCWFPQKRCLPDCRSLDSGAAPSGGFAEGSSLLSSGSLLSQPNMSIPEEAILPGEHSALQLPPPLLAPIHKAYPGGSQELHITPDMLFSPNHIRKVGFRASDPFAVEGTDRKHGLIRSFVSDCSCNALCVSSNC